MKAYRYFPRLLPFLLFLLLGLLSGCGSRVPNPDLSLTLDYYAPLRRGPLRVDSAAVRREIGRMVRADADTTTADYRTRSYYLSGAPLLWIDRQGCDHRADTLLAALDTLQREGLAPARFCVAQLRSDLARARAARYDTAHTASRVLARLEYALTKSYLRLAMGRRYGFVNPHYLLNHLDLADTTAGSAPGYRTLYAVETLLPRQHAYAEALRKIVADSVGVFLRESEPRSALYRRLRGLLPAAAGARRDRILVAMERERWRLPATDATAAATKYVEVNIPAFMLRAVDGDQVLEMRVGCGALRTKTPLLVGLIHRMEINPQWVIPRSIVRESVLRHIGDSAYFARNRYFIRERATGRTVEPGRATAEMLLSPAYHVIQEGGAGNSLGRIIFRFANAYSIYLHDTSSPEFFARPWRAVSHGCVRVERPFDLATFLFADKSSADLPRIRYSMQADVSHLGHGRHASDAAPDTLRRAMLIGVARVEPQVAVRIGYHTLWPDADGRLRDYPDVYGYDRVIARYLTNFTASR